MNRSLDQTLAGVWSSLRLAARVCHILAIIETNAIRASGGIDALQGLRKRLVADIHESEPSIAGRCRCGAPVARGFLDCQPCWREHHKDEQPLQPWEEKS